MKYKILLSALAGVVLLVSCVSAPLFMRHMNQAAINQNNGNYLEAERLHRLALEEMREIPDMPPEYVAVQMSNLGSVLTLLGRHESALSYAEQSVELLGAPGGRLLPEASRLAVMNNYGLALSLNNRVSEAEAICKNSLGSVLDGALGKSELYNILEATANFCLAMVEAKKGNLAAGDEHFRTSKEIIASDPLTKGYQNIISTMEKMYSDQVYGVEEVVSE